MRPHAWPGTDNVCMPFEGQDLICTLVVLCKSLHITSCSRVICGHTQSTDYLKELVSQADETLQGSLVCLDARVCKNLFVELSRHPDLVHGITAALPLRTQPVGLEHCAAHEKSLTRLQVVGWTVVGAAPFKVGD